MSTPLAVAALSARMLVEAACEGGYRPLALDLFGDADTRAGAAAWWPIGVPGHLAIDGDALLGALRALAADGAAAGWIAGSGFEGEPELLSAAARVLPLIGNRPAVVARVRDPGWFYARLAALGLPHPETTVMRPAVPAGWLAKDAAKSGGWAVGPLAGPTPGAGEGARGAPYYQRAAAGEPMSALFLADGRSAALVGVSRQIVRALGPRPYVFRGCIGPVALPPAAHRELAAMLDALVVDFGLRGLNGLDFLLEGERLAVLELNPRPSASMDLYRGTLPHGLVRAHVAAAAGRLPAVQATPAGIRGFEVVYASHRSRLADPAALACHDWCHDRPTAPLELGWGEPVCTVSAAGATAAEVEAQLAARRRQIRSLLELVHE